MRPIDIVTERDWAGANCDIVLERIREEVDAELRARDATRGIPLIQDLFDENGTTIGTTDSFKVYVDDGKKSFIVDQHLASLKHTGRERRLMIKRRWVQFCSQRRDEAAEAAAAGMTARASELALMLESTSEVEASDKALGPEKSTPPETTTSDAAVSATFDVKSDKPFQCEQCGRLFARKAHLTNHMKKHARETVGV